MAHFHISGLSDELTGEVRDTLRSPGYGHPVVREVATGTGPCRACLGLFHTGTDERLLFTYRPHSERGTLGGARVGGEVQVADASGTGEDPPVGGVPLGAEPDVGPLGAVVDPADRLVAGRGRVVRLTPRPTTRVGVP